METTPVINTTMVTITSSDSSDSVVTHFTVKWERDTSIGCADSDENTTTVYDNFTDYTIRGLEEGNRYTITVRTHNRAGDSSLSNTLTVTTTEKGETKTVNLYSVTLYYGCRLSYYYYSILCLI